jgi:hypothetical protein
MVSGCGLLPVTTSDPVVDGLAIGPEIPCRTDEMTELGCERLEAAARRELDLTSPGHAPVVAITLHRFGTTIGPNGERITTTVGAPSFLFLLDLADGRQRAVSLGCGVDVTPDMDCLATPSP